MWGCGGDSAVQPGFRGGEEGHTHTHTYTGTHTHTGNVHANVAPTLLATYPLKSARFSNLDHLVHIIYKNITLYKWYSS